MGAVGSRHRRSVQEHISKRSAGSDIPLTDIVIKSTRLLKHIIKICAACHIPATDVPIKSRSVKCSIEISHVPYIPLRYVLIKDIGLAEHQFERGCIAHIPSRNVTIKGGFDIKRMVEIGHIAHIPARDRPKSRVIPPSGTQPRHRLFSETASNMRPQCCV